MSSQPDVAEQQPKALTKAVQALIVINIAVMFLQLVVVPMSAWLGFDLSELPGRWWTVLTYMFVHVGAWHLIANMYGLYLFGPRLEQEWGTKKFTWFYLFCGLGGVVFQMLFFTGKGQLVGASAAVFGVMTASAMLWPDEEVYLLFVLPTRARALVVGLLVFNLVVGVAGTGDGAVNIAYLAHLGGIVAAYVYMRMATSTGIDQVRQRVANLPDADEPPRAIPRNMPRRERTDEVDDIVAKSKAIAAKRPVTITPVSQHREPKPDELNRVLDKISQHGIDSLTSEERRVLEDVSRRLRDNKG